MSGLKTGTFLTMIINLKTICNEPSLDDQSPLFDNEVVGPMGKAGSLTKMNPHTIIPVYAQTCIWISKLNWI